MSQLKFTFKIDVDEIMKAVERGDKMITLTVATTSPHAVRGLVPGGKARSRCPRRTLWMQCMQDWIDYQRTLTGRTRRPSLRWMTEWFSDHRCSVTSRTLKRDISEMTAAHPRPGKPDRRDSDFTWIWNRLPDWIWSKTDAPRLADILSRALPSRRAGILSPDIVNPLPGGKNAWQPTS